MGKEERGVDFQWAANSFSLLAGVSASSFSQAATGRSCCSYIVHLKLIASFVIPRSLHTRCRA